MLSSAVVSTTLLAAANAVLLNISSRALFPPKYTDDSYKRSFQSIPSVEGPFPPSINTAISSSIDILDGTVQSFIEGVTNNLEYIFKTADFEDGVLIPIHQILYAFDESSLSPMIFLFTNEDAFFQSWGGVVPSDLKFSDGDLRYECDPDPDSDDEAIELYTWERNIVLCPQFYSLPALPDQCWQKSQGGALLREVTLQDDVMNTGPEDHFTDAAWGEDILDLDPDTLKTTPDAYQFFCVQQYLGCVNGVIPN